MTDIATAIKNLANAIEHQSQMTHASVVIATTAILDTQLERGLKLAMRPMSKNRYKRLFDSFRPLHSFSSKITMAYALGIVTHQVHGELEKIRQIRNAFAHSSESLHLGSKPIAPLFAKLKKPESRVTKPLLVFLACAKAIDAELNAYILSKGGSPA